MSEWRMDTKSIWRGDREDQGTSNITGNRSVKKRGISGVSDMDVSSQGDLTRHSGG